MIWLSCINSILLRECWSVAGCSCNTGSCCTVVVVSFLGKGLADRGDQQAVWNSALSLAHWLLSKSLGATHRERERKKIEKKKVNKPQNKGCCHQVKDKNLPRETRETGETGEPIFYTGRWGCSSSVDPIQLSPGNVYFFFILPFQFSFMDQNGEARLR